MKKTEKYLRTLVNPGVPYVGEAAGAAVGSTIGFFVLGPLGAVVGATGGKVVTDLFSRAGEELEKKFLSKRESARIGMVALYAMNRIKTNLENNLQVRHDDFFIRDREIDHSAADEILEGTLIAAKNEHEELKLMFYGNLVANIAFNSEIDRSHANYLLRISENLSYRQICLLALFNRKLNYNLTSEREAQKTQKMNKKIIFQEIGEMKISGLVWCKDEFMMGGGAMGNKTPALVELTDVGKTLHELMGLDEIDELEINKLAILLSDPI